MTKSKREMVRGACWLLGAVLATGASGVADAAPVVTQTFQLNPGWNAVYLEVEPQAASPAAVFAGVPIASVWTWDPRRSTVDFIESPSEGLFNRPGWLGHFPAARPESIVNNLFTIQANRAYLVKLDGGAPVNWTVSGRPVLKDMEWVTNSFNLTGLPINPTAPPTFGNFFAASPAHAGQPIYRLNAAGIWEPVGAPFSTAVKSGEAYWIYCKGASTFTGPLSVTVASGFGLDFDQLIAEQPLTLRSFGAPSTVSVRLLPSADPVPLAYGQVGADTITTWVDLPVPYAVLVDSAADTTVRLAVKRAGITADQVDSVLEVTNGLGVRRMVPVSAQRVGAPPPALVTKTAMGELAAAAPILPVGSLAGLWVGSARINQVSEAQVGSQLPKPTRSEFTLRLLIHVDASNNARLLKEVVQMKRALADGSEQLALVTDSTLIPEFKGVALRDGQPVGYRISSAAIDFDAPDASNTLPMLGTFGTSGALNVTLNLGTANPTNPFRHKFHPDHDNLDRSFESLPPGSEEAYPLKRIIEMVFSPTDPSGRANPAYGSTTIAGTYRETFGVTESRTLPDPDGPGPLTSRTYDATVGGLHRNVIVVRGSFELSRVSPVAELNK